MAKPTSQPDHEHVSASTALARSEGRETAPLGQKRGGLARTKAPTLASDLSASSKLSVGKALTCWPCPPQAPQRHRQSLGSALTT